MMDQPQTVHNETPEQLDVQKNKDIAAFGYIWIMSLVVYFSKRESPFATFHSKQGIVLFLLSIPVSFIPFFGKYLVFLLAAGMLLGFINAAQGHKRDVPFIGPLSRGELHFADILAAVMRTIRQGADRMKHLIKQHAEQKMPASPSPVPVPSATLPIDL